ncbi:MAG TPA: single-stranded-DNA-specific exonuclease RecJ [Anaerolineales bacterium]|nr:single-stranded-DNA-specific exonuclease RecJ [Anaerolineales bacterium]
MTRWLDPLPVDTSPLSTLNLPPFVAQTLIRRGILTPDAAQAFLHPEALPSTPFPGIDSAVSLIHLAIRRKDRICVWGDFDVDGQTSTALLVQTLRALGADVVYYIPIRGKESHGVHIESLKPILDNGAKLILTCDTGITAHEAIDYANSRGADVVVTDHHEFGETLPNARAILNPKLLPAGHPLKNLAGVGVAFKLAEALITNYESQITPHALLDLVALGLIADVAVLQGETRSLAQKGIDRLRTTNRLGLRVMAELSGTSLEMLTEDTIGFSFAPRLNALGRLSDANPAVEFLLTNDPARARVLAAQIEGLNAQRRLLTSQVNEAAEAQLRQNPSLLTEPAIILSHPNWPGGVVGIVANRLVDRYHKPALLLTESEDGILRGSARSVEGLHITEAIAMQKNLLLGFGGHPMAAGLSMQKESLPAFRKGLGKAIEKQLGAIIREEPTLPIDTWLGLDEIDLELAEALEALAPFGAGNPELTLATRAVSLRSITEIGKAKEHLRLTVEDENGAAQHVLWWGGAGEELANPSSPLRAGNKFDIAYTLRASSFRGQKQVSLQFQEIRVVEEKPVEVRTSDLEIRDWRLELDRLDSLNKDVLVWAEGADKSKGKSRFELHPAEEFAIYTTPPSPTDLRAALDRVKPKKIYVFAVSPVMGGSPSTPKLTDEFLTRLAGMAKYAINNRGGKVSIQGLASAMAQRERAIRIGLEWLVAGGHLAVLGEAEADAVHLSAGNGETNQYLQKELYIAVKGILEEITAYRKYFSRANLDAIMGSASELV